jgi:hypothetical protein
MLTVLVKLSQRHCLCWFKDRVLAVSFTGLPVMLDAYNPPHGIEEPCSPTNEGEVVELPLLLPGWQASRLETVAHQRGMTAAAMVRHLLRDFLTVSPNSHCMPSTR